MSRRPSQPAAPRSRAWLFALPVAEYLALSALVDARELDPLLGVVPIEHAGRLGPIVLSIVTSFVLLGGRELAAAFRAESDEPPWWRRSALLAAHAVSFGSFLGLAFATSRGALEDASMGTALACSATFVALGLTIAISFLALAAPAAVRRWAAAEGRRPLVLSLLVGVLAATVGFLAERLWPFLATGTVWLVENMLVFAPGHVWVDPSVPTIGIDRFSVRVAPVCSGSEGLGLMAVLVPTYLVAFRKELRFPGALLLLPLSFAAAYLLNGFRIAALILVGRFVSVDLAVSGFHSKAGWVAFCLVAIGVVAIGRRHFGRTTEAPEHLVEGPAASFLAPELGVLATALATGLFAIDVDRLYGLRVAAGVFLLAIRRYNWAPAIAWRRTMPAIAVGIVAYGLWVLLSTATVHDRAVEAFLAEAPTFERVTWLATRVLGSVLVIPLVEELAFRGFLMRWTKSRAFAEVDPTTVGSRGVVISSVVFGVLHSNAIAGVIVGLLYGELYRRRGRLGDAVIAHAVTNALVAIEALALGHYGRW